MTLLRFLVTGYLGPVYFTAHMIFLAVQPVLFTFCDMTIMTVCHPSFFLADLVITLVKRLCLASADITISHFMIDPAILII